MADELYWAGKPVSTMTRDELIAALTQSCRKINDLLAPDEIRARALGRVEMVKRGEKAYKVKENGEGYVATAMPQSPSAPGTCPEPPPS